jgi:hypothetical protein
MKLLTSILALLTAGMGAAAALAQAPPKPRTILVCHATHAKTRPYVLVRVAVSAVRARLRHGDVMPANGTCPGPAAPASTTSSTRTDPGTTTTSS